MTGSKVIPLLVNLTRWYKHDCKMREDLLESFDYQLGKLFMIRLRSSFLMLRSQRTDLVVSTLLEPRFKTFGFCTEGTSDQAVT